MSVRKIFNRDFSLLFLSQFAMSFVFHIYIPTLPIYLSRKGCSEVEIGVLIGVQGISSLVLRPFVGRALVNVFEKNFMLAGAVLFTLTAAAYVVAFPFWPFLAVRVFQGVALAFYYTAALTMVARISPEEHRGQSLGYYLLSINFSFALAPILGMSLVNSYGFDVLFVVCTGFSLCSLFVTSRIQGRKSDIGEGPPAENEALFNWHVFPPALMILMTHMIWGSLTAFFPLFALTHGVSNPGFFFAVYAIILVLGRSFGGRLLDLYSREKVILPCLTAYVISMVILALSKTLPMFALVAVIWGTGNCFLVPALMALTLDLAGASRGPAVGLFSAMGDLGTGMGPVIMGIVLRLTSYPTMFLCLALTASINFCYFYFFVRSKVKAALQPS